MIRHGEAEHNVDDDALHKRDTELTKVGREQAKDLGSRLVKIKTDVVLTSPVLRALQTTKHMLAGASVAEAKLKKKKWDFTPEVILDLRERVSCADHLCEFPVDPKRIEKGMIRDNFGFYNWTDTQKRVGEFESLEEFEENISSYDLCEDTDNINERAMELRTYLNQRKETRITVVSHGAFLMYLTDDEYMDNCELRS